MVVLNFMLTRIFCVAKQISADGNHGHQTTLARQGIFWSNEGPTPLKELHTMGIITLSWYFTWLALALYNYGLQYLITC